jgi:hypothetical protein
MPDGCLLLFAHSGDPAIHTLRQQASHRVEHVSIADLTRDGWRYESGRPDHASACAGGRIIPAEHIAAVVCRIAAVTPSDLAHVHRDDRAYVAAEATAFLRAWLAQFTGVRFNEPTWVSLAGPGWHPLHWTWLVRELAIPAVASPLASAAGRRERPLTATVVHEEVFGVADPAVIDYSLRIARAVNAELLAVTFVRDSDWRFLSADPCPPLDSASAAALLRLAFARGSGSSITEDVGALCRAS